MDVDIFLLAYVSYTHPVHKHTGQFISMAFNTLRGGKKKKRKKKKAAGRQDTLRHSVSSFRRSFGKC